MSTGHPRRPTRGVVRPCVGGLRRPVVPSKSESGGALSQPAPVPVTTGESDRAMHAQASAVDDTFPGRGAESGNEARSALRWLWPRGRVGVESEPLDCRDVIVI